MPHKDPEKKKAGQKKWREENKEKVRAGQKKWEKENPEYYKNYREENKEKGRAYKKKWNEENPEYDKKRLEDIKKTQPSVIYMIECKATNKYYIGQTSRCFWDRIQDHKSRFRNNRNDCGTGMQDDYNKYGPDAFEYSILKELDPQAPEEELLREEKNYIIKFIKENKELYNSLI